MNAELQYHKSFAGDIYDRSLPAKYEASFFKRQFKAGPTAGRVKFDLIFGILLPVICFFFDPIVFRSNDALLAAYAPFAYILSYLSVMGLLAFILFGEKLKGFNAFLSGLFLAGVLMSLTIGVVLLPFSFFGLAILIGVLGFTPFFTSLVFARNARLAHRTASLSMDKKLLRRTFILGIVFGICIPIAVGGSASHWLGVKKVKVSSQSTFG